MVDNIEHISDDWQDGSTIDVLQEMTMLAMSVVTESLFGINFRDRETFSKVNGAFTNILEHFTQINEPVKNLLDEGSESVEQNKFQDSLMEHIKKTAPEKTNLISHLMKSKDPDTGGVSLPENQIRDEIMVLAFAGHDYFFI